MDSEILSFKNIENKIVYNPTIPFKHSGKKYIGVRTESVDSEFDSEIRFAYKDSDHWVIDTSLPSFQLQDPAITTIKNNMLLSGVYVERKNEGCDWRTEFYLGSDISRLNKIASSPWGMKDIRLVELDKEIGVFTRPLGGVYGRGKIGFLKIKDINDLKYISEKEWYNATILNDIFDQEHWGGVNQAIKLKNNYIGVIGHDAYLTYDENGKPQKNYYAISFILNPDTLKHSKMTIIATRDDFPESQAKRSPELRNILIPAGIDGLEKLYCDFYGGLSDYCTGQKEIKNPFDLSKIILEF